MTRTDTALLKLIPKTLKSIESELKEARKPCR